MSDGRERAEATNRGSEERGGDAGVQLLPGVDVAAQLRPLKAELLGAIERVLDHGQLILGPEVRELEKALAEFLCLPRVMTLRSGTDALLMALRLHGIGPGDEVITVSHSFVATASAVALLGAVPVFVDVELSSLTMDPRALEAALTGRTKAVIPVHLCGAPCDMAPIVEFCETRKLALIEDSAQAIAASYRGRPVGSFGTGAFSMHPLKVLAACGDGGFISLREDSEVEITARLRNLGLADRDHCSDVSAHSRLDTLQAALLLVKLRYLPQWIAKRRSHANAYREALSGSFDMMELPAGAESVYSTFVLRSPERDRLVSQMRERGFDLKVHYPIPIHRQKAFAYLSAPALPVTERIVNEIVSLPVSHELRDGQRDRLIEALRDWAKTRKL